MPDPQFIPYKPCRKITVYFQLNVIGLPPPLSLEAARTLFRLTVSFKNGAVSYIAGASLKRPAPIFEMSRMSLIIPSRNAPDWRIRLMLFISGGVRQITGLRVSQFYFRKADYSVQGSAYLVTHLGEKPAFSGVGFPCYFRLTV